MKNIAVWMIFSIFLVAIADFLPKLAVGLGLLMILDILLVNSNKYTSLINSLQTGSN